jgi:cell division protein FtsW
MQGRGHPQEVHLRSRVRYAAEETLVSSAAMSRKRLPRSANSAGQYWHLPNLERLRQVVGAGLAVRLAAPAPPAAPAREVEEQKRLAELEMRLPRLAGKIDAWLLIIVLTLLCIGIVMVYSASSFVAARYEGDASFYFQRELIWVILGLGAMLLTMRVDYRQWRRFSLIGMVIILPLLVIVLRFGVNVYGASRWLAFGSFFSFQPSELTKLVLALYIADWLARKGSQVGTFLYGLIPFVILVGVVLGLVLLENDMGTAIIIAGFATVMFFTAGANITQFLLAMACGGLIFLKEALKGYRYYRLTGFLNPFNDITGINLQLYQSLLALGSGGWFGVGLGASRQKTGYLPLPYTDSIFAITGEELGFIGCALIVILFLFLAFRGFRLARRSQDLYGALLATGITTWLVLQAMINIGATTGTIPYTGVPLPFISFGGSSLIVSLAAIGVLLNISRYIQEPETPALSRQTITMSFQKKKP